MVEHVSRNASNLKKLKSRAFNRTNYVEFKEIDLLTISNNLSSY